MIVYKDIEAFNQYVGLPKPLDNDINIGMYDGIKMRLYSEPIMIDFYRISIKTNYVDIYASDYNPDNPQAIKGVFFGVCSSNCVSLNLSLFFYFYSDTIYYGDS